MPIISSDYKINHEPVDEDSGEFNDIVFFNVDVKRNHELFDYVKRSGFSGEFDQYRKRERWVKDNTKIDAPALRGFRVMLSYFIGQIYW